MVKKFTIPFASQGDANDIPDALQVDGKVSFTQGFGYDYERPYDDPQAKDIAREDMNGLFKAITSAVGELQTLGSSEWSNAISYPKGAIVYYEEDLYISQVDDNQSTPPQSWVSITSIANDSLKKAANLSDLTNKATARNNLGLGSSATLNKTDTLGTSTSLVATQKLVNDTKINLESSKQDKLTFTGTGNVARMSEVNKKRDITDGKFNTAINLSRSDNYPTLYFDNNYGSLVLQKSPIGDFHVTSRDSSGEEVGRMILPPTKNGYFASTADIPNILQSTGSSTTSVMSQKAVTDQLNAIKSSHGLGYGQTWVSVTSQRVAGTTYTNNTGKPIYVVYFGVGSYSSARMYVDGKQIDYSLSNASQSVVVSAGGIVPPGSTYSCSGSPMSSWTELR